MIEKLETEKKLRFKREVLRHLKGLCENTEF